MAEETYNCSEQCEPLDASIDQNQLAYRLIKLRIRVLRANIGKLLCLCVPEREKWTEFGWDGKAVDEILDDLSKIDIPVYHPGDPEFQNTFIAHKNATNQKHSVEEEDQSPKKENMSPIKGDLQPDRGNKDESSSKPKNVTTLNDTNDDGTFREPNESEADEYIEIVDAEDEIEKDVILSDEQFSLIGGK